MNYNMMRSCSKTLFGYNQEKELFPEGTYLVVVRENAGSPPPRRRRVISFGGGLGLALVAILNPRRVIKRVKFILGTRFRGRF
jgi:hypothetical protein